MVSPVDGGDDCGGVGGADSNDDGDKYDNGGGDDNGGDVMVWVW